MDRSDPRHSDASYPQVPGSRGGGYIVRVSEPSRRLVLVPGLGLDARSAARVRDRVQAEVTLLPGMGLAGPVPAVDVLAARLLASLGEGPVVLVGHSQSCQVVAAAALDPRVAAVVLL